MLTNYTHILDQGFGIHFIQTFYVKGSSTVWVSQTVNTKEDGFPSGAYPPRSAD